MLMSSRTLPRPWFPRIAPAIAPAGLWALSVLGGFVGFAIPAAASDLSSAAAQENILYIQLKDGIVEVQLRPDLAPQHVERIKTLAQEGFYDRLPFHRVIAGFMAQTGDPKGDGTGGSNLPNLRAEFTAHPFERGVLGMARSRSPDSANSQFFIMFAPAPHLNGQYTVFGEVRKGMEFVDNIKKGASHLNGSVADPDIMIRVRLHPPQNGS